MCDSFQKCTRRDVKCQAGKSLFFCPAAHWCLGFTFQVSLFLYVGMCPYRIRWIHIILISADRLFIYLFIYSIFAYFQLAIRTGTFFAAKCSVMQWNMYPLLMLFLVHCNKAFESFDGKHCLVEKMISLSSIFLMFILCNLTELSVLGSEQTANARLVEWGRQFCLVWIFISACYRGQKASDFCACIPGVKLELWTRIQEFYPFCNI